MRHSIAIALVVLTVGSVAQAERYNVRSPQTGRFIKQPAAARPAMQTAHTSPAIAHVATSLAAHAPAPAPAASRGRFGSWLHNNFTVSSEMHNHVATAGALRSEGRLVDAAAHLNSAPQARGLFERIAIGRARTKVQNGLISGMKKAAATGNAEGALHNAGGLALMSEHMNESQIAHAEGKIAESQQIALKASNKFAKHYDLDAAQGALHAAAKLGANGADMTQGFAKLQSRAITNAKGYARHGMFKEAMAAMDYAQEYSKGTGIAISDASVEKMLNKTTAVAIPGNMTLARRWSGKGGNPEMVVKHLLDVEEIHNLTGIALSSRDQKAFAKLSATYAPMMNEARQMRDEARAKSAARAAAGDDGEYGPEHGAQHGAENVAANDNVF